MRSGKGLLCECDPQNPHRQKKPDVVTCTYNPGAGEAETDKSLGHFSLLKDEPQAWRPSLKKKVDGSEEPHQKLYSGLQIHEAHMVCILRNTSALETLPNIYMCAHARAHKYTHTHSHTFRSTNRERGWRYEKRRAEGLTSFNLGLPNKIARD